MGTSMRCPRCGVIQAAGLSCESCGAPLREPMPPSGSPPSEAPISETPSPPPAQPPPTEQAPLPRFSRLALLSLYAALFPVPVAISFPLLDWIWPGRPYWHPPGARYKGHPFSSIPIDVQVMEFAFIACPLIALVLAIMALIRIALSHGRLRGKELAVAVMFLAVLELIAFPNLFFAGRRSRYSMAASDAKIAVTQAIVYAKDKGMYPTSVRVLADTGYADLRFPKKDPWGNDWVLAPVLTKGAKPKPDDHVWICSKGRKGTGLCGWPPLEGPPPSTTDGSVGYSTIYGSWQGI